MKSKYFTEKEALYLPKWSRVANEDDGLTDEVRANLTLLLTKMDVIREHFNKPINVHCCYRPSEYNKLVGGAPSSAHMQGKAIDFSIMGLTCDEVRQSILDNDLLETLQMRMEDLPGSSWVHLDIAPVKSKRFFKP